MKRILSLVTVLILAGCYSNCYSQQKGKTVPKEIKSNLAPVELIINQPAEGFIWKKGEYLYLNAKLNNKSQSPITILMPKLSSTISTDYFAVNFVKGNKLNFESNREKPGSRKGDEFLTIMPGKSVELYINGEIYLTKYSDNQGQNTGIVKLNLSYNIESEKHEYNSESDFIKNNYKATLSEGEELIVKTKIKELLQSNQVKEMGEEEKDNFIKSREKHLRQEITNSTPQEQAVMIEKFNSLYKGKIISNVITVKIEK